MATAATSSSDGSTKQGVKRKPPVICWESLDPLKKTKASVEKTWITQETIRFSNVADITIKAGTRKYYLSSIQEEGEKTSELILVNTYR